MQEKQRISWMNRKISSRSLLILYPLLVVIGKIVRWTIMRATLINYSKGWGYIDEIVSGAGKFQFFGVEEVASTNSDAWGNTIVILQMVRKLFLDKVNTFQTLEIAITILWSIMLLLILARLKNEITLMQWTFIMLTCIVLNVYDFVVAKEPVQMLYFVLMFFILVSEHLSSIQKRFGVYACILLSVATFRVYYVMILCFSIAFDCFLWYLTKKKKEWFIKQKKITPLGMVAMFFLMCVVYLLLMTALRFTSGTLFRRFADCLLLASDATSSSNTYIENMVAPESTNNVILIAIEYTIVIIRMCFPLELLKNGVKYYPYVVYQLLMTVLLLNSLKCYKKNTKEQNIALSISVGFLFASATFEVDFGAWVRHNAVIFPVLILMNDTIYIKRKLIRYHMKEPKLYG